MAQGRGGTHHTQVERGIGVATAWLLQGTGARRHHRPTGTGAAKPVGTLLGATDEAMCGRLMNVNVTRAFSGIQAVLPPVPEGGPIVLPRRACADEKDLPSHAGDGAWHPGTRGARDANAGNR